MRSRQLPVGKHAANSDPRRSPRAKTAHYQRPMLGGNGLALAALPCSVIPGAFWEEYGIGMNAVADLRVQQLEAVSLLSPN